MGGSAYILLLHHFKLKVEFLAAKDHREIELPKLARETKPRPALIEIDDKLQTDRAPEIRKADASDDRPEFGCCVKRKRSLRRHETGERITVEVIAVCRIGGPVRVRVVRREDLQLTTWPRNAMQFIDEADDVGHMLDYVITNDLFKLVVGEWIGKNTKVVNNVGMTTGIGVDADRAGKFILATAYVQNSLRRFGHAISFSATANLPARRG